MVKKKKEVCPYCGQSFTYLSRHKCKVKEQVENVESSEKTRVERRLERIEEKKQTSSRGLRKKEKMVLDIIRKKRELYFEDLLELTQMDRNELDDALETLVLQSKIKIRREMVNASWTKFISIIEEIDIKPEEIKVDINRNDFILELFSYQPCLICPFTDKCDETNLDRFNPRYCEWLTEWINKLLKGETYKVNFDEFQEDSMD
ncbi:MAG: hypothetical protein ACTSUX_06615 [Promethearchaeota archaeon]